MKHAADALDQADARALKQMALNLLSNALKFTPKGGSVSVAVRPLATGAATITVSDTGVGIAAEELPRIFDRFYRADTSRNRETGGSGLGLAIAKSIVTAHNGTVFVEKTHGGGATFVVELPLTQPSKP